MAFVYLILQNVTTITVSQVIGSIKSLGIENI